MSPRLSRRRFLTVAAAALVAGPVAAETTRWRGVALGAEAEITLRGPRAGAEAALAAARASLAEAEALFSLYREDSVLARLNRTGAAVAPARFAALLDLCDRVHRATGGQFDPTVQPLWRALATGGDPVAARALVGWGRVLREGARVRLGPGQALTLNGVAQGVASDMVSAALAAHGYADTLANIGEFRAGGGRWRIGVEDPAAGLVGVAELTAGGVATSSPAATLVGGEAHILSPAAGARPLWSTVSVEARTAGLADGLSTAFCLMDRGEIEAAVRRITGVSRVTLVDAAGGTTALRF